jgi:hypothetical protein
MNAWDYWTVVLILGTAVAWIGWDVMLGAKQQDTESMWIAKWARRWAFLPFFVGALAGHWFLQSTNPDYTAWPWAVACLGAVFAFDVSRFWWAPPVWLRHPGIWLLLGLPAGHFLWPQRFVP